MTTQLIMIQSNEYTIIDYTIGCMHSQITIQLAIYIIKWLYNCLYK